MGSRRPTSDADRMIMRRYDARYRRRGENPPRGGSSRGSHGREVREREASAHRWRERARNAHRLLGGTDAARHPCEARLPQARHDVLPPVGREHAATHALRIARERAACGHPVRAHPLDATKQLLMLDLLVAEADECFERAWSPSQCSRLVSSNLAAMNRSTRPKMFKYVRPGSGSASAARQEVGRSTCDRPEEIEGAPTDHVAIDVPSDALRVWRRTSRNGRRRRAAWRIACSL